MYCMGKFIKELLQSRAQELKGIYLYSFKRDDKMKHRREEMVRLTIRQNKFTLHVHTSTLLKRFICVYYNTLFLL